MKHAAALVLLLTIAATPVTTFVCVASCAPERVPATATCHHPAQSSAPVNVTSSDDPCDQLLTVRPFLTESVQSSAGAIVAAPVPPAPFSVTPPAPHLIFGRELASAAHHRAATSLVLRV